MSTKVQLSQPKTVIDMVLECFVNRSDWQRDALRCIVSIGQNLTHLDNLPEPDEVVKQIIENLEAGLNSFREVLIGLEKTG